MLLLQVSAPITGTQDKRDIALPEQVQKRATKIIRELDQLSYRDRLMELGLFSLEETPGRPPVFQCLKRAYEEGGATFYMA